jgi:hypothetical protein
MEEMGACGSVKKQDIPKWEDQNYLKKVRILAFGDSLTQVFQIIFTKYNKNWCPTQFNDSYYYISSVL